MKKLLCVLMLAGIIQASFAQNKSKSDQTFDLPENFVHRKFTIALPQGNKIQLEVDHIADIEIFRNMDSLLTAFLTDMEPFTDSLDELTSKRIDYVIDGSGSRKIRIQQFAPKGSTYVIRNGQPASLKLEQDTINFIGTVFFRPKYTLRKRFDAYRSYRLSLQINNISELRSLINGDLNRKMATLSADVTKAWKPAGSNAVHMKNDTSITARWPHGFVAGGDYLNIRVTVDLQNYKNYFVPSFNIGAGLIISSHGFFKREIIASWEPHFLFSKNAQGQLKTFRNDFLGLTWGQGMIKDFEPRKESELLAILSVGYLIHREGDFFTKHTFRFGAGRLSLFNGKTKIEPAMYFNNFFKGVTPAVRLLQSF